MRLMTSKPSPPTGLAKGGAALWRAIVKDHDLDVTQRVQLEEACRAKDRLDKLDRVLRGDDDTWVEVLGDEDHFTCHLNVAPALGKANETANLMKQLLAALRLPDKATGKRPQQRGGARGAYQSGGASGGDSNGSALGALRGLKGGKAG
jgi:hypothetical protein